ncbi:divalent cation tolerance protein CutA [Novosphingobium sp.]|uniref:divalent cation tolerance protein CutA n=1 Tax=Novosphingobium sp. TaxID=1874826 RepID=UPI00286E88DC|nr:divalent cation tolerance protein CutA [Novosphingobium sp.]
MTAKGPALAWCPFPDTESAEASINTVLDEGVGACANIIAARQSRFVWNGNREESVEVGVLFKTDLALPDAQVMGALVA